MHVSTYTMKDPPTSAGKSSKIKYEVFFIANPNESLRIGLKSSS